MRPLPPLQEYCFSTWKCRAVSPCGPAELHEVHSRRTSASITTVRETHAEAEFLQRHHPLTDFSLVLKGAGSIIPILGVPINLNFGLVDELTRTASCFLSPVTGAGIRGLRWNSVCMAEALTQQGLGQQPDFGRRSGDYAWQEQYSREMQSSCMQAALELVLQTSH